jgi:hypothetical protein
VGTSRSSLAVCPVSREATMNGSTMHTNVYSGFSEAT